jgi:disulfide bond formation protein DsbB
MPITQQPLAWFLLALSALALEGAALYFQHGLDLDPCVLCIYQRAAVAGVFISALFGFVLHRFTPTRLLALLGWGAFTVWCLYLAVKLSGMQLGWIAPSLSCEVKAKFPLWLKLDQWLPEMFQPTGFCGEIQWQFLGLSMPLWLVIVMLFNLIVWAYAIYVEARSALNDRKSVSRVSKANNPSE